MEDKSKLIQQMNVMSFIARHADYYDKYTLENIKSYVRRGKEKELFYTDVVREIYDELGYIPDEKNMYVAFLNLLEQIHGIDGKNIVEVGGGTFPRLGERIHLKQNKGTITVFDPRLGKDLESKDRFILKREEFTKKTPIEGTDLIIGLMPCKGAEPLIEQALKHKIDFMLWFCEGGPHGDYFDYFEDEEEWLGSTMYMAQRGVEDKKMGKVMVKKFEDLSHYPIIYNQR